MRLALFASLGVLALVLGQGGQAQDKGQPDPKKQTQPLFRVHAEQLIKDYDKNGDGFLQKDEVPAYLREHFDKLDTNKDGKLSREELEQGAAYLHPRRRPSDAIFILIEMSDCDDDCSGEIQRVYDMLRKIDKNNDGKIDAAELKAARHMLVEERVDNIFKELDTDKDGKISRAEARGHIKAHFDKIDANKDGFIDRQELLNAASERVMDKQDKKEGK